MGHLEQGMYRNRVSANGPYHWAASTGGPAVACHVMPCASAVYVSNKISLPLSADGVPVAWISSHQFLLFWSTRLHSHPFSLYCNWLKSLYVPVVFICFVRISRFIPTRHTRIRPRSQNEHLSTSWCVHRETHGYIDLTQSVGATTK